MLPAPVVTAAAARGADRPAGNRLSHARLSRPDRPPKGRWRVPGGMAYGPPFPRPVRPGTGGYGMVLAKRRAGLSASTVRTIYTVPRAALDVAVRDGLIQRNPAAA